MQPSPRLEEHPDLPLEAVHLSRPARGARQVTPVGLLAVLTMATIIGVLAVLLTG